MVSIHSILFVVLFRLSKFSLTFEGVSVVNSEQHFLYLSLFHHQERRGHIISGCSNS